MLFYLFIVVANVASEGCPYQTPWTNVIRRLAYLLVKRAFLYTLQFETWRYLSEAGQSDRRCPHTPPHRTTDQIGNIR